MKAGIASNLFVVETLSELGIELAGDLTFESVVDEEFGGVNGTLAGRLMGYNGDAAILSEPTSTRVCPAQRGGRTVHITFAAPNGGILAPARGSDVTEQLRLFLNAQWRPRIRFMPTLKTPFRLRWRGFTQPPGALQNPPTCRPSAGLNSSGKRCRANPSKASTGTLTAGWSRCHPSHSLASRFRARGKYFTSQAIFWDRRSRSGKAAADLRH